ncbi:cation diffusion facilitator CzcD-associated flavoprotein CzcO [Pontibacter ummariensis]|uniref:Predicted flavoprotein CzcO associated with the cation diffusion facilitator CzcD n=1 Tax=Pontibacter ummariensis TaxID=1610492 RepID=A0A239G2P6_9BACT|nr:NAD(P)/FAD-dependent oxidoreductase [Pontibacter ummariensis]PRY11656.1 cation diffusion facilitator CzcD-associated flavoprotein CzcO [Pontibacter ummariensis]SNS63636.1 Predicted flavoprotein CzcO associated with the cation diffusion facilitator CzcD [Pontibacter ummariensis]
MPEDALWLVTDRQGNSTAVKVLLLGLGPLNRPHVPDFPGLGCYSGQYFHSARWDTSFNWKGKRVGVIGTGASAVQIVPGIAPEVAQLTVFQRTPAWVSHRFDKRFPPFSNWLFKRFPILQKLLREAIYWVSEFIGLGFIGNKRISKLLTWLSLRKLKKEVKDSDTRRKLTPNYTIGCKRILRSDDYYPAFNRSNVHLVTEPIQQFAPKGILTSDAMEHQLNAVVFATGFVAADMDLYTKVIGSEGNNLLDEWQAKGAEAYKGTTVSGYPNLAFILGPNTGLGHNSVVHMMESQMNYIMQYIQYLERSGEDSYLNLKEEVQQAYNNRLQQELKNTVWASGCKSWYLNKKGKNTTLYPRLTVTFRKETRHFNPEAYQVLKAASRNPAQV